MFEKHWSRKYISFIHKTISKTYQHTHNYKDLLIAIAKLDTILLPIEQYELSQNNTKSHDKAQQSITNTIQWLKIIKNIYKELLLIILSLLWFFFLICTIIKVSSIRMFLFISCLLVLCIFSFLLNALILLIYFIFILVIFLFSFDSGRVF